MLHGIHEYFVERARFSRRISLLTVVIAIALISALFALRIPALRDLLHRQPLRFGFEGPEEFVRRILLDTTPVVPLATQNGVAFRTRQSVEGGRTDVSRSRSPAARPEMRPLRTGQGDSERDLIALARELHPDARVFRSEELVVEKLVRPEYPEEARARGTEGPVALLARVDVRGDVVGVDVMSSSGAGPLDAAAAAAVWQCRFRPYEVDGEVQEVYAVFRFRFRLY